MWSTCAWVDQDGLDVLGSAAGPAHRLLDGRPGTDPGSPQLDECDPVTVHQDQPVDQAGAGQVHAVRPRW